MEDEILLEFIELFVHKIYVEISDSWENMYMILLLEFTGTVVDYLGILPEKLVILGRKDASSVLSKPLQLQKCVAFLGICQF